MIRVKVNLPIRGFVVGQEVRVAVDREGTPLDATWRRRLRDAETDNCCEVVKTRLAKKPASPATESKLKE
jgi:hypothetical protein